MITQEPKISTKQYFNYSELISKSKYGFIVDGVVHIITDETDPENLKGHTIKIYNDGIEINSDFSFGKRMIETDTLTTNVNKLICDWLNSINESEMVQDVDSFSGMVIKEKKKLTLKERAFPANHENG